MPNAFIKLTRIFTYSHRDIGIRNEYIAMSLPCDKVFKEFLSFNEFIFKNLLIMIMYSNASGEESSASHLPLT